MYSSVFSWRQNDTTESSSLRSGAGSAFQLTAQRLQSCVDRNETIDPSITQGNFKVPQVKKITFRSAEVL